MGPTHCQPHHPVHLVPNSVIMALCLGEGLMVMMLRISHFRCLVLDVGGVSGPISLLMEAGGGDHGGLGIDLCTFGGDTAGGGWCFTSLLRPYSESVSCL